MMSEQVKPRYLWFRISIALGVMLGLLLLIQTVMTYRYVSRSLVRQEAAREADRRAQSVTRAARLMSSRESGSLTPVLHDMVHESSQMLAWMRILTMDGRVMAESENVSDAPKYSAADMRRMMNFGRGGGRGPGPDPRVQEMGKVLVVMSPLRMGPPPAPRPPSDPSEQIPPMPRGPRPQQEVLETAIYVDGVSVHFGQLRQNMIVGTSASIALIGAMVFIGLRFKNYMRGKHIEEELSLARRVQHDLFPSESGLAKRFPFAAKCVPAWQVGGDLYDVFETDDGEIGLVLGDVSGKGLPAALLMGLVQGALRAACGTGATANHEQAASRLNHVLCEKTAMERFVSLFWCYFDREAMLLRYINAGHQPALLFRTAGSRAVDKLEPTGPVLGVLPGAAYAQAEVRVDPGDLLAVFSDGILEATDAQDREFGEEGAIATIWRNIDRHPSEICAALLEDVRLFLGKELPHDDQTLMIVRLERRQVGLESGRERQSKVAAVR